jgi:hypothetical protein
MFPSPRLSDSTELLVFNRRQPNPGCQEEMKHTAVDTVSWHFVYPRRQEFDPYVRIDFGLVLPLPRYSVKPGGGGVIMVILNCALLIRWILALNSVSPAAVSPQFLTRLHRLRLGTMLHRNEGEGEGERERERKGGREGGRGGGEREGGRGGGGRKRERERERERMTDAGHDFEDTVDHATTSV